MSFISNLRKSVANFIAPNTIIVPANAKSLTQPVTPQHMLNQAERIAEPRSYPGKVSASQLQGLNSTYLKDAIAQFGAWSALARAFSEYERVVNKRSKDDVKLGALIDEFHCWNAATSDDKQMDEQSVMDVAARLTQVSPAKGNDQTDKIIARVRKCSVEELRTLRTKEAEVATAKRESMLEGFIAQVWSFASGDYDYALSGVKAVTKAIQTMEFVARSWTGDPANIAGELLLMEADLKTLEAIAAKDEDTDPDARFINGVLTADGMMNQEHDARHFGNERRDLTPKAREAVDTTERLEENERKLRRIRKTS